MGKKRKACGFFCYLLLFFFMGLIPLAGRAEVRVDLPTSRAQIFSRAWSASGRYFCFLQQNISQRAGARLVSTTKNLIKWRHFGANYLNTGDKTKSKYSPQKKKQYTDQLNLDQHSSSHVSYSVIGFDWRRISKTVRDWIKPTGEKFLL